MSSVFHLHRNESLPLSQSATREASSGPGIRRRLSSLSLNLKIQPSSSSSAAAAWAMRRSKSISAMGEYAGSSVRRWWGWGWGWILARKPTFAADLEMNEDEAAAIGSHSWRHVIHKIASQLRRKLRGSDGVGLPQTFRYDSFNYAKNFDDGRSAASLIH
ncbi:hypothetical protein SASPL_124655 [Salvia splendens]|uniref:Uncharacterized protein n=1 Tax=Salvia splendens TaxID=180675 RepID=A0A8X8XEI9_SALSN|nr:uncharacterized protein LOC121747730 [Salvia splendens]KAG6411998.1 hypothetical protein SASPL_124655 [Salvia splendens]